MGAIALGTVQFGLKYGVANTSGQVPLEVAREILKLAQNAGVRTLDTARDYGVSETVLGELGVDHWRVITKISALPENVSDPRRQVNDWIESSLQRLKVERIGGLLLHRPEQLLSPHGGALYAELRKQQEIGRIEKIGISIYSPDELDRIIPQFDVDIVQTPYNIFDRRIEMSGWLDKLRSLNVEVHGRSAYLQGLLLMKAAARPSWTHRWHDIWSEWDKWLTDNNLTAVEASLRFCLSSPKLDAVVVGVQSVEELHAMLEAKDKMLLMPPPKFHLDDITLIDPSRWPKS